jgi:hypothetical protein
MSYAPGALPSAREFWTKHVGGSKPAFFPGLGRTHPAFTRWRSDEALARAFGEFQVQVEPAVEQRLSEHCARQVQDEATGRLEWVDSRSVRPPHLCPAQLLWMYSRRTMYKCHWRSFWAVVAASGCI